MMRSARLHFMGALPAAADSLRLAVLGIWLCLCTGIVAPSAAAQSAPECSPTPSFDKPPPDQLPADVCQRSGIQPDQLEKDFDTLAWQTFKFLVWPAEKLRRGEPDKQKKITDIDNDAPRIFETFKADWEIFLPGGAPPLRNWNWYPRLATPCENLSKIENGALVLAAYSEFGNLLELVGGANEMGNNEIGNLLVAQNSTYVRYLAAYNKPVYATIRNRRLYDLQTPLQRVGNGEAVPRAANQPAGALTVKSAWIELREPSDPLRGHIDPSRFYTRKAWVQTPGTHACEEKKVALVGLHFVHKTKSRPQWIWTTFEHIDNVPDPDQDPTPGKTYTFNNGDRSQHMSAQPDPDYILPLPPGETGPKNPPTPYQVERLQHLREPAKTANSLWRQELKDLGSVWQYYQLVATQWPAAAFSPTLDAAHAGPVPSCAGLGEYQPATANTVIETFLQGVAECDKTTTCMGCHGRARKADFVWSILMNHHSQLPEGLVPPSRAMAIETLKEIVHKAEKQ